MDIQRSHLRGDLLCGDAFPVESEWTELGGGLEGAANDKVLLASWTLQLNLDVSLLCARLDKCVDVACASEGLCAGLDAPEDTRNNVHWQANLDPSK